MSHQNLSPSSKAEEQETERVSHPFSSEYVVPDLNLIPEETEMDISAPPVHVYTCKNRKNENINQVSDRNTRQKLTAEEKDMPKSLTHSKSILPEVANKTESDPQLTPAQGSLAIKETDKVVIEKTMEDLQSEKKEVQVLLAHTKETAETSKSAGKRKTVI